MAVAARKIDNRTPAAARNHLRLVTTPPAKRTAGRAADRSRVRAEEARAKAAFTAFMTVLLCAIVLGGARVTLIAKAAEASMSETTIQTNIKQQREVADQLEVDRSALSTPSRIAGIASQSMDMGEPRSVRYISESEAVGSAATGSGGSAGARLDGVVGAVVDLSAGEAQSLLVGDLGLAGSR